MIAVHDFASTTTWFAPSHHCCKLPIINSPILKNVICFRKKSILGKFIQISEKEKPYFGTAKIKDLRDQGSEGSINRT